MLHSLGSNRCDKKLVWKSRHAHAAGFIRSRASLGWQHFVIKMWDAERRLLFVHVPKTGGSAIEAALIHNIHGRRRVGKDWKAWLVARHLLRDCGVGRSMRAVDSYAARQTHLSDVESRSILRRCYNITELTSFAVVRNPLEVRASAWVWLREHGPPRIREMTSFEEFVASGAVADERRIGLMARSQSSMLSPHTKLFAYQCQPVRVLRFLRRFYQLRALPHTMDVIDQLEDTQTILTNMSAAARQVRRKGRGRLPRPKCCGRHTRAAERFCLCPPCL